MANTSAEVGSGTAPMSLVGRFVGVITAPKATFEAIVAHPRWFGMLALVCLVLTLLVGGFMFTEVGRNAWLDAALASSGDVSDQQVRSMEQISQYVGFITIGYMLVFLPIFYLVVAGILYAVFNAGMGGNATFKQVYAVVVHTGPIGVLAQLFTVPLNYARETMTSATNLSVLVPMLPEDSFIAMFLGAIDLFLVWQMIVLAIGLAVLYRRRTQPIATALLIVYGVIALIIAAVRSW